MDRKTIGKQSRAEGEIFEHLIDSTLKIYNNDGVAYIEKTPEPMKPIRSLKNGQFVACYTKAGQPDYKGTVAGGRAVVFEAKHTNKDRILASRITTEQYAALEQHFNLGADVAVLVSFSLRNFYRVPWGVWRDMKAIYGRKYIKEEDIAEYELDYDGYMLRLF